MSGVVSSSKALRQVSRWFHIADHTRLPPYLAFLPTTKQASSSMQRNDSVWALLCSHARMPLGQRRARTGRGPATVSLPGKAKKKISRSRGGAAAAGRDDDDETPHDVTRVVAGEAKGPRRRARFWRRNAIWSCGCGARLPAARARCTVVGVGAVARAGVSALLCCHICRQLPN
jgi:hypothetical protein